MEVAEGEFLVLVGPSGSGKTTTLRLIAGLEETDSGSILLDGTVLNTLSPRNRDVAMVFQHSALYPHLTVSANLGLGLKLRKVPKLEIQRRTQDAAERLGLGPFLDRWPGTLSAGQRQRVALGRALVRQPKVFLFDEPLSHLDAPSRMQLRAEIHRLHAQLDATIIYVTHDQLEAMALGDRIAVLHEGMLQQVAEPFTIYRQPKNRFVASFFGSPPMNLIPGSLVENDRLLHFVESGEATGPGRLKAGVSGPQASGLAAHIGRPVLLGLRPEHISIDTAAAADARTVLMAEIERVEAVGHETHWHLSTGAHSFVARGLAEASGKPGQPVSVRFDLSQIHFFDAATGQSLA